MAYIGNDPSNRFVAPKAASVFSGDGSTTAFTLDHAVGSDEDILVSVDGVIQEPSVAYAVSNGTTLTFTAAPSSNSGNNIFVYYLFRTVGTVSHPSNNALQATDGTFTGDLTVDTDTLKVDATNDQVGVNTTAMNSYYAKDLVVSSANQGGITVVGGTSDTQYLMFADGTSGADRYRGYIEYSHSQNKLSLASNAAIGLQIDTSGHVLKPLQPAFHAHKNGTDETNLAINTNHTIAWAAERFDQNSDFDLSANQFVAPVTGKYFLSASARFEAVDADATYYLWTIVTSNQTYHIVFDPNFTSDLTYFDVNVNVLADMDASDTAAIRVLQSGGTAQLDIDGGSYFSGYLVC